MKDIPRLVAVGDVHGELEGFQEILLAENLIDSQKKWSGGKDILLQIGDVVDRGPYSLEVFAYLKELQHQADTAGGRVVAVGTTSLRLLESAAKVSGEIQPWSGETAIFITPGYRFKAVDVLMTNFHLPRSTLFMLVAAFSGLETMKAAYAHAIRAGYRFYSYGDACLLEPEARK